MAQKIKYEDKKCPSHGAISIRGRTFIGIVVNAKAHRSATIEWERKKYIPKYERYEKKRTKIQVHNPDCINAVKGDKVRIGECRPISKTKHFVILEKLGKDILFVEKEKLREEAKVKPEKELKNESS